MDHVASFVDLKKTEHGWVSLNKFQRVLILLK